jgi:hypothetical protein
MCHGNRIASREATDGGSMFTKLMLFISLLMVVVSACPVQAQGESRLILGGSAFLDEETPFDHFITGVSYGFDLTGRLRIEPQFLVMFGPGNDRDYVITGNVAYDFLEKENLELYVVAGAGLLHHRNQFGPGPAFSGNEATFNGGVGMKIQITERMFLSPEFRLGTEPLFVATVGVGYRF